jgi:hypothetical protein
MLIDQRGRTVQFALLPADEHTIDVSRLPSGPYVARISCGGIVEDQRIVIVH